MKESDQKSRLRRKAFLIEKGPHVSTKKLLRVIFATSGAPIASVILISPALQVVGMLVLLNDKQKRLTYRFTVVRTWCVCRHRAVD